MPRSTGPTPGRRSGTEPGRRRLQAVSEHLAVLLAAGVVAQRRQGRQVYVTVEPDRLEAARGR
jgi:hypothetical protein